MVSRHSTKNKFNDYTWEIEIDNLHRLFILGSDSGSFVIEFKEWKFLHFKTHFSFVSNENIYNTVSISFDKIYEFFLQGEKILWSNQSKENKKAQAILEIKSIIVSNNGQTINSIREDGIYICTHSTNNEKTKPDSYDIILKFLSKKVIILNFGVPYFISKLDIELINKSLVNGNNDHITEFKQSNNNISIFFYDDFEKGTGVELIGFLSTSSINFDMYLITYSYSTKSVEKVMKFSDLIFNFVSYTELALIEQSQKLKIEDFIGSWEDEDSNFSFSITNKPELSTQFIMCIALSNDGTHYIGKSTLNDKSLKIHYYESGNKELTQKIDTVANLKILSFSHSSFSYEVNNDGKIFHARRTGG